MSDKEKDILKPPTDIDEAKSVGQVLKRLVGYMTGGDATSKFIVALVLRIIGLLGLIALPFSTGQAVNVVSDNGDVSELWGWVAIAAVAGAIYIGLSLLAEYSFADLATKALYKVQTHLFNHMQTLSLTFFDRQPLGELMSRVTNDTEVLALFYENAVAQVIRSAFQILLIVIMMFVINWQLALAALSIAPILLIATLVIERISSPAFAKLQEDVGQLSGFQEETISGSKVLISNRRHDWANQMHQAYAGGVFDVGSKAFFTSLVQFSAYAGPGNLADDGCTAGWWYTGA